MVAMYGLKIPAKCFVGKTKAIYLFIHVFKAI